MVPILLLNCLLASAGYLTIGILIAWPATALPSIRDSLDYELGTEYQSWIGSTGHLGALFGTLSYKLILRNIGTRQTLILCGVISLVGWTLIFVSSLSSLYVIYPGLFLVGWSCGLACPTSSVYVSELAGGGNKGMVTSIFNFNLTVGGLTTDVLGVLAGWFYSSLAIMLLHVVLFAAVLLLMPTPRELARDGDIDKIIQVLEKLRSDDKETIIEEARVIRKAVEKEKIDLKKSMRKRMKMMDKTLFKKWGIILMVFSFNQLTGIMVTSAFLVDIFSSTEISDFVLVMARGVSEMIFSFLVMMVADRLGRKTFLMLSGLGTSLSTAAFAAIFWIHQNKDQEISFLGSEFLISSNLFLVLCLLVYYFSYNIGFGPMKHTLLSEMFTPMEQENIAGLCYIWHWLLGFIVVKIFHVLFINYGLVTIFISISTLCMASVGFTFTFVPETLQQRMVFK